MEIWKLNQKNFAETTKKAVEFIKKGKVIVCPTDTVYGLLTLAVNKKAVEKVFKIKKRDSNKPIPIFIKDIRMAKKLAFIDERQEKLLKELWPGKVTVILRSKGKDQRPKLYGIKKETVGLRIPNYNLINILLKKINLPLTGTSANISGRFSSTKSREILRQFYKRKIQPDLFIDAGNLSQSRPSKIIDLTSGELKILRE